MLRKNQTGNRGFTLIEVAIVLLIGGIMLASAAALLDNYITQTQITATERRIAAVDEALQLFLNLNGRYPCPAPINVAIDDAAGEFGFEDFVAGAGCAVSPVAAGRGGRDVRIGAVPVRTLNLPDDFVGDAWGGRFTYGVTEALAEEGTYNRTEGAIRVLDSAGNDLAVVPVTLEAGTAHYVIVSHGENNSGAQDLAGLGTFPCTAGNLEEENCNGDAIFRSTILAGTANNASLYDDMVTFRATTSFGDQVPSGAVMAFNLNACPDGWTPYDIASGRFIVGANAGKYTVEVSRAGEPVDDDGGGPDTADAEDFNTTSLAEGEIPFQTFATGMNLGAVAAAFPGGTDFVVVNPPGADTGAGHQNLPPYIALLYCQKS